MFINPNNEHADGQAADVQVATRCRIIECINRWLFHPESTPALGAGSLGGRAAVALTCLGEALAKMDDGV